MPRLRPAVPSGTTAGDSTIIQYQETGLGRSFVFFAVTLGMNKFKAIHECLKKSTSFHYLEDYCTENKITAMSLSRDNFTIMLRPLFEDVLLDFELIVDPVYLSLYTYGSIADAVGRLGVFLSAPRPTESGTTKILLRKVISLRLLGTDDEIEAELKTFCYAIDVAMRYMERLEVAVHLPNVDISMWEGVDLQFTDIGHIVERRAIAYPDWDHFIDTIISISDDELPEDYKEEIIKIMVACKEFERVNDHLKLPEVIGPLVGMLEELDGKPKPKRKNYDIN